MGVLTALTGVRGAVLSAVLPLSLLAQPAMAVDLPSGLSPDLSEVLVDQVGLQTWLRFRFVVPQIGQDATDALSFDQIKDDFPVMCAHLALPYMSKYDLTADIIVISFADRHVEFGVSDPDATQYFEQFRSENGDCIWEAF
ncbi:MAG: DUF6497 family protein [Aliishimia sp.]